LVLQLSAPSEVSPNRGALLMSMAEIAGLAGVRRPVVTTWRRRHPDFPAPTNGDSLSPLFDARQVADWLTTTGRDRDGAVEADLSLYAVAGLGTRAGLPPRDLVAIITALICLRAVDDEPLALSASGDMRARLLHRAAQADPDDACLLSELAGLPTDPGWLASATDELVEAAWGCTGAFERVMASGQRFRIGALCPRMVSPALGRLVAELSGARERAATAEQTISVCDPAAGAGDMLTAVADAVGPDHQILLCAAEADRYLARLTARRLTVHGVAWPDLAMVTGTAADVPAGWGDPDVTVTEIPYVSAETRSAEEVMDRLDEIALRLAPGRTAVVVGPAAVLSGELRPFSPAERSRARLLSSGMVEAVIRLPGGLVPFRPGYEVAVWVLTSAYDSPWRGWVLLADVSDRDLTDEVVAGLAEDVVTWRRDGYQPHAHTRMFSVQVPVTDLVDSLRPLTAHRHSPPSGRGTTTSGPLTRVAEIEAGLDQARSRAVAVRPQLRSRIGEARRPAPPVHSIGALAKAGRLVIRPGSRLRGVQAGEGHHDVIGAPELTGRSRRGDRRIDRVALAGQPRAELTEPGDVIVTTAPQFAVLVDHDGLAAVEFPVKVLRIPAAERQTFTPRTLAALLAAGAAGPRGRPGGERPSGAVRARRLEEREVPVLSPEDARSLDDLLTALDTRRDAAQQELDLLADLRDITAAGLIDGTLTF
jgi:hypothetical protein